MHKETKLYGLRAILEAIEADKSIDKIFLQKGLRSACEDGRESWEGCFNGGARFLSVAAFQHLFV